MKHYAEEGKKYYIAYGSNLNVAAMKERCPRATILGTGALNNVSLAYKGFQEGRAYLTLVDAPGKQTRVGVWAIDSSDEKKLDHYEAYPELYTKAMYDVLVTPFEKGTPFIVSALIYIMQDGCRYLQPSEGYVQICDEGYRDFLFDAAPLYQALEEACEREGEY